MSNAELLAAGVALREAARARIAAMAPPRSHAEEVIARFDEVDATLVAKGFPPTSLWWRAAFERWYRGGKRQLVARVGRRGGKSSSLSRLAVVEALYGRHSVPPGDVGVVAVVSTDRSEAYGRLRTIEAILDALGIAYRPCRGGIIGIELVSRRIAFRVFTASISGVSGFTSVFVMCDEVSKWSDADTGANPASEVLASIRPTMQTQTNARMVLSSSPMGMYDAHFDAFELGETDGQVVAHAPSWVANPTITEEQTRRDEPNESRWAREYAAIPQTEAESSLISEYLVDRAVRRLPQPWHTPYIEGHHYVAAMDPATRGHAWTFVVATRGVDGVRRIAYAQEWRGSPSYPLRPGAVLAEIHTIAASYGLRVVTTDQHAIDHLRDLCPKGLHLREAAWTLQTKRDGYEHVLTLLQDERLELHPDPQVKADLLGIRKCFTRTGVTYELAEVHGRHSDYAPAVALAVDDARWVAKAPELVLDDSSEAKVKKVAFLEGRRKDRERRERFGAMPVTHRTR